MVITMGEGLVTSGKGGAPEGSVSWLLTSLRSRYV